MTTKTRAAKLHPKYLNNLKTRDWFNKYVIHNN